MTNPRADSEVAGTGRDREIVVLLLAAVAVGLLAHVGNQAVDAASMEQVGWPELAGQVNQAY